MRYRLFLLLALTALAVGACRVSEVRTPNGFVALDEDDIQWRDYVWKAVSPDGAVVVVRERDNKEEGSLEFWAEALEREVIERQGYKLIDKGPVQGRNVKGTQLNFEALYGGQPYFYSVAIFTDEDSIVTVETAASAEVWERHEAALQGAVQSTEFQ
jgi:hypothetical protein